MLLTRRRALRAFSSSRASFNMLQGSKMRYCLPKSSHLPNVVPWFLPASIIAFLASSCALSEKEVEDCWTVVKEIVWSAYILDDKAVSAAFKDHGTDKGFGSLFLRFESPSSNLMTA